MSTTSNLFTLLAVVAAGAVALAVLKAKLAGQQSAGAVTLTF